MAVDFDALCLGPIFDAMAEPVTWTPAATGVQVTARADGGGDLRGVFSNLPAPVQMLGIELPRTRDLLITQPRLGLRASEWPANPVEGDAIAVHGGSYIVAEPPTVDGFGHVGLILNEA